MNTAMMSTASRGTYNTGTTRRRGKSPSSGPPEGWYDNDCYYDESFYRCKARLEREAKEREAKEREREAKNAIMQNVNHQKEALKMLAEAQKRVNERKALKQKVKAEEEEEGR